DPTNDTYRDLDNLVKFTTMTDKLENGKYEIKTKIEEITFDSFSDRFWGAILKPKSTLKEKVKGPLILKNPLGPTEINIIDLPNALNREFQEKSIISRSTLAGAKEYFRDLARGIFWYLLFPLLFLNLFVILFNKKVRRIEEAKRPIRIFKKLVFTVVVFIVSAGLYFLIGITASPWILIPFVLLLIYLNVKESKKGDRLVKISLKILWIIIIIILVGIILLWFYSYTRPSIFEGGPEIKLKELQQKSPILELATFPDLDLHLYCDDGKHIGMNYETGEYEIQIAEAIVSGDNQNIPEWILIPETITNCHFVVSSYDNQKFLEENPEIAAQLTDASDSYEIYARYIDPTTDIYTSQILLNQLINPDENIIHQAQGTTTISVTEGVVYNFSGFLPPIKTDGTGIYKQGRTLPTKFQLTDANNNYIATAIAELFVAKISDGVVGTDEIPLSTSAADTGNIFRYDAEGNQYIYNLSTDTLSVGTWQLKVVLDDGKNYTVIISIK
ncbi:MAG: PxKF domain-containing protein, partial [Methanosarcinales archaeon]